MRFQGQAKLGFFPLPSSEAVRLRRLLTFPEQFSALDPCVGDGVAFTALLESSNALSYGIEIDAHRSEQARSLGIEVLHANALDVRCTAESVSLLYLNPPYDWEYGRGKNERLELIFPAAHLSMAQGRRRASVRDSPAPNRAVRSIARLTFSRHKGLPVDCPRIHAIQTDRDPGRAAEAT